MRIPQKSACQSPGRFFAGTVLSVLSFTGEVHAAGINRSVLEEHWYLVLIALLLLIMALSYFGGLIRRLNRLTASMKAQLADRKRVDDALEASEAFYHSLVEHLPLNIVRKDLQ